MNIGFLDRRITFQAPGTSTNDYGEITGAWTDYTTVWAALDNKSASSGIVQEQEVTINRVTWRVRSSTTTRAITPKYRVNYKGDFYSILAVQEVGRDNELHFITERVKSE